MKVRENGGKVERKPKIKGRTREAWETGVKSKSPEMQKLQEIREKKWNIGRNAEEIGGEQRRGGTKEVREIMQPCPVR